MQSKKTHPNFATDTLTQKINGKMKKIISEYAGKNFKFLDECIKQNIDYRHYINQNIDEIIRWRKEGGYTAIRGEYKNLTRAQQIQQITYESQQTISYLKQRFKIKYPHESPTGATHPSPTAQNMKA